jgi:4-hydroxybenzoate polyprenyltransferase
VDQGENGEMLRAVVRAVRPSQWVKNLIIAAPLVFSLNIFHWPMVRWVLLAFGIFSAGASAVYLLNDIVDLKRDRAHPLKCHRPIASGALPVSIAAVMALVLGIGSVALAFVIQRWFGLVLLVYVLTNLAYSFYLKRVVIIDVMILASGFVFRVLSGALVIGVPASEWLIMCTMLLALFLGFAKRRHEIELLAGAAEAHRQVLHHYSSYLLDQMIMVVGAATVLSYALYTVAPSTIEHFGTRNLIYSVPFVIYGLFRYLYLVHRQAKGGDPTRVFLTDAPILANTCLWLLTCGLLIYGGRP